MTPVADGLQLPVDPASATPPARSARADGIGTWLRSITIFADPALAKRRGHRARRPRRPPTAPSVAEPPPLQPLPEHCGTGSDARMRGRQRAIPDGANGDRQRARQPGNDHRPARGAGADGSPRRREVQRDLLPRHGRPGPDSRSGSCVILLIVVGIYLAFAKSTPVHRAPATSSRRPSPTRSDLRPSPRCGSPASTSARSPGVERKGNASVVTFTVTDEGRPIHEDATVRDPAADLPRGQLLPRPRPGQPERARAAPTAASDPDHAHLDRGPARRDPDRAADAPAGEPAAAARGARHGASPTRRRPPTTPTRIPTSRARAPRRRSTTPSTTAATPAATSAIVNEALLGTEPRRPLAS